MRPLENLIGTALLAAVIAASLLTATRDARA